MAEFALFEKSLGLNNVFEDDRLFYLEGGYSYLQETADVIVDGSGSIKRRYGFAEIFNLASHSLWVSGDFCFFVSDGTLYRILSDNSVVVVVSGIDNAEMYYVKEFGKVYATNGVNRFIITETAVSSWSSTAPIQNSVDTRQLGMIEGFTKMTVHAGRLLVLKGNRVWQSEPGNFGCFDKVDGSIPFEVVHGFISVGTGVYLSCEDGVVFLDGASKKDFVKRLVYTLPAVDGKFILTDGSKLGRPGEYLGICVEWISKDGLCIGDSRGVVRNVTSAKVSFPDPSGCAIVNAGDYTLFSLEV